MNIQLSQQELREFSEKGETVIVSGKRAFEIRHSHGVGELILAPIPGKAAKPYTQAGRFHALTPEHFYKLQTGR